MTACWAWTVLISGFQRAVGIGTPTSLKSLQFVMRWHSPSWAVIFVGLVGHIRLESTMIWTFSANHMQFFWALWESGSWWWVCWWGAAEGEVSSLSHNWKGKIENDDSHAVKARNNQQKVQTMGNFTTGLSEQPHSSQRRFCCNLCCYPACYWEWWAIIYSRIRWH